VEWVETTGRSIEEAKDAALDRLGVDESEAEFEVVDEPRFGLFGRLRSEARIRARVRPTAPRPKQDRRDRRRRRRGDAADGTAVAMSAADEAGDDGFPLPGTSPSEAATDLAAAGGGTGRGSRSPDTRHGSIARAAASQGTSSPKSASPTRNSSRLAGDQQNGAAVGDGTDTRAAETSGAAGAADDHGGDGGTAMDVSLGEQADVARQFLDGLVEEMDLDAEISINHLDEDTVELRVDGKDLGLLIGARGATLLALQDLTRTVVQRRTGAANGRLLVDVSAYRQKRKEALERFVRQLADEVKSRGTRKVLEPMSAADRKIVHDTVNAMDGVTTTSEGEEPRRRVIILASAR
jgi:spoIIIJ-associated protein